MTLNHSINEAYIQCREFWKFLDVLFYFFVLASEKMDFYENVHSFINVATILPPGVQNLWSHNRPRYNRMCVITRRVISRVHRTLSLTTYICFSEHILFLRLWKIMTHTHSLQENIKVESKTIHGLQFTVPHFHCCSITLSI